MNDLTDKYLPNTKKKISSNKLIGVLPPSQISNYNLFEKQSKEFTDKTIKKGLIKVILFFIFFRMKNMLLLMKLFGNFSILIIMVHLKLYFLKMMIYIFHLLKLPTIKFLIQLLKIHYLIYLLI